MAKASPKRRESKQYGFIIFAALATIAFVPKAMDAFSFPKSAVIASGGIWFLAANFKDIKNLRADVISKILWAFSLWLLILLIVSDYKWVSLFGVNGRSTGILFYLALVMIFLELDFSKLISKNRFTTAF